MLGASDSLFIVAMTYIYEHVHTYTYTRGARGCKILRHVYRKFVKINEVTVTAYQLSMHQ